MVRYLPRNKQDLFQSGGILRKGGGHGACASERAIRLRGHLHHLEVAALRLLGALPERRPGVVLCELLLEDNWNGHEVGVLAQLPCTCKKKKSQLIDRFASAAAWSAHHGEQECPSSKELKSTPFFKSLKMPLGLPRVKVKTFFHFHPPCFVGLLYTPLWALS